MCRGKTKLTKEEMIYTNNKSVRLVKEIIRSFGSYPKVGTEGKIIGRHTHKGYLEILVKFKGKASPVACKAIGYFEVAE